MISTRKKVIFRVDGNSNIGLGHIVRCCALADMLKNSFDCYFYMRKTSREITEDVRKYCISIYELSNDVSYEEEAETWIDLLQDNEIVVLDGYHFNTEYQSKIKSKDCKLLCIDDIYAFHFVCDILVNHAGGARIEDYSTEAYTKVYVGLKYALLRNAFLQKSKLINKQPENSEIFICMGGADPENHTLQILNSILHLHTGNINVVVGSAYKYFADLQTISHKIGSRIKLYHNIEASEVVNIMRRSSIAICTPSTVAFEYLSVVNGFLYLNVIADNQKRFYDFLISSGLGFSFQDLVGNRKVIPNYSLQNDYFDGFQAERYKKIFSSLAA